MVLDNSERSPTPLETMPSDGHTTYTVGYLSITQSHDGVDGPSIGTLHYKRHPLMPDHHSFDGSTSQDRVLVGFLEDAADMFTHAKQGELTLPDELVGYTNPRMARFCIKRLGFGTTHDDNDPDVLKGNVQEIERAFGLRMITDFPGVARGVLDETVKQTGGDINQERLEIQSRNKDDSQRVRILISEANSLLRESSSLVNMSEFGSFLEGVHYRIWQSGRIFDKSSFALSEAVNEMHGSHIDSERESKPLKERIRPIGITARASEVERSVESMVRPDGDKHDLFLRVKERSQ